MPSDALTATSFCLRGEQTVRTIAETHGALAKFYASADAIAIDASGLTDADLTLVQLIEAVRRSAARDQKRLCLSSPLPDALRDVLVRGGFLNAPDDALFWSAP